MIDIHHLFTGSDSIDTTVVKKGAAAHSITPDHSFSIGSKYIVGSDIPFEPGSIAAKKAWSQVEQLAHSPENVTKCKALGYEKGAGMYNNKPLVPGVAGPGQADFKFLVDKLIYHDGLEPTVASKIAGKIAWTKYGVR